MCAPLLWAPPCPEGTRGRDGPSGGAPPRRGRQGPPAKRPCSPPCSTRTWKGQLLSHFILFLKFIYSLQNLQKVLCAMPLRMSHGNPASSHRADVGKRAKRPPVTRAEFPEDGDLCQAPLHPAGPRGAAKHAWLGQRQERQWGWGRAGEGPQALDRESGGLNGPLPSPAA